MRIHVATVAVPSSPNALAFRTRRGTLADGHVELWEQWRDHTSNEEVEEIQDCLGYPPGN